MANIKSTTPGPYGTTIDESAEFIDKLAYVQQELEESASSMLESLLQRKEEVIACSRDYIGKYPLSAVGAGVVFGLVVGLLAAR